MRFRKPKRQPIPQLKYANTAYETAIDDIGTLISMYIKPHDQHPNRDVTATYEIDCLVANVDINNKGNIQGIEIILSRRPGQEPPTY